MPPLPHPTTYLITSGALTADTGPAAPAWRELLAHIAAAVAAGLTLIQLREKLLPPHTLYELTACAARLTRDTPTRLLVNDRADIARAAGADGVHLTTQSIPAHIVRRLFGPEFLIGVSTHSLNEAQAARAAGADFAVFGPVFNTPSKRVYGPPLGLDQLSHAARALAPFPLLALGGITRATGPQVLRRGAHGIAGISLFHDAADLRAVVQEIERAG